MTRYEEIMDQIVVTDEMRDRILNKIDWQLRRGGGKRRRTQPARMWLPMVAAAAVLLVVCGVAFNQFGSRNAATGTGEVALSTESMETTDKARVAEEETAVTSAADEMDGVAVDSDVAADSDAAEGTQAAAIYAPEEYNSAAELSEAVGFEVKDLTTVPFAIASIEYYAIDTDFAEIDVHSMGSVSNLCYRKSVGTEDNSGDYNTYSVVVDAAIGEYPLTLSGDEQAFYLATWTDGTYAYSIGVTGGCTENELRGMVEEVMQ